MTTTIGIKFKDGVILAADRQVSSETFVASKYGEKIHKVFDNIGVTIAGLVSDAINLVERLRAEFKLYYYDKKRPISVDAASQLASKIIYNMFRTGRPFYTQMLLAGITNGYGPKLYV
ncbi:MAG: proteasome subunit beta, partial [Candidatus Helarchaeota archaeon]